MLISFQNLALKMGEIQRESSVAQQRLQDFLRLYHERMQCVQALTLASTTVPKSPVSPYGDQTCTDPPLASTSISPLSIPSCTDTGTDTPLIFSPVTHTIFPPVTSMTSLSAPASPFSDAAEARQRALMSRKKNLDEHLSTFAREILGARTALTTRCDEISRESEEALQKLLEVELKDWERQQRLTTNGLPNASATASSSSSSLSSSLSASSQSTHVAARLNVIRSKCQRLADVLWKLSECVEAIVQRTRQLPDAASGDHLRRLTEIGEQIRRHTIRLVSGALIVDKQPPQVLKTQTRFQCQVRHLLGTHVASGHGNDGRGGDGATPVRNRTLSPSGPPSSSPVVTAHMINEAEYAKFMRGEKRVGEDAIADCGVIQNNAAKLEYNVKNRTLVATFPHLQLKSIRRAEKKGERVAEEKFVILYHCKIDWPSATGAASLSSTPSSPITTGPTKMITCHAWTVSSAMGVIVHASQECNTFGTIFWDNAFAAPRRESFATPEFVAWADLAASLNSCFAATTGRHLSPINIEFLRMKLLQVCWLS